MYEGRLLCPADRESAQSSARRQAGESEEADHRARVERIRAAASTAARTLKARGHPTLTLAVVKSAVKTRSSAYGDVYSRKGWWELKQRLGQGWILFTATHDQLEGARTEATVALAEDGRLFWVETEGEVELGAKRLLGGPRETVLGVGEELDPEEKMIWDPARERALGELEAQLAKHLA